MMQDVGLKQKSDSHDVKLEFKCQTATVPHIRLKAKRRRDGVDGADPEHNTLCREAQTLTHYIHSLILIRN